MKSSLLSVNHKKLKYSFTLIELSVVVVIISIMFSLILASKSLINNAKINKIYEEFRMYNNSIQLFYDKYGCLPGDCQTTQIPDLISNGFPSACLAPNATGDSSYNILGTGYIDSTFKGTCAFFALQIAGYINGVNPSYATLVDSVAGSTIPYAKFSQKAAWSLQTTVGSTQTYQGAYCFNWQTGWLKLPGEIGGYAPYDPTTLPWLNTTALTLRDANLTTGRLYGMFFASNGNNSSINYSVSSNLTAKIDIKFDDGLPYTGKIIGTLNAIDWNFNNGSPNHCNTLSRATVSTATYLNTNDINSGCLVNFAVSNVN